MNIWRRRSSAIVVGSKSSILFLLYPFPWGSSRKLPLSRKFGHAVLVIPPSFSRPRQRADVLFPSTDCLSRALLPRIIEMILFSLLICSIDWHCSPGAAGVLHIFLLLTLYCCGTLILTCCLLVCSTRCHLRA